MAVIVREKRLVALQEGTFSSFSVRERSVMAHAGYDLVYHRWAVERKDAKVVIVSERPIPGCSVILNFGMTM
jgi:hypothetical protein